MSFAGFQLACQGHDEDFALALLEQDLLDAERRSQRARRRSSEDELLAMILAISAAEEQAEPRAEPSRAEMLRARLPTTSLQAAEARGECRWAFESRS